MSNRIRPQTFCIYCQKDYVTPTRLGRHILKQHKQTYADLNLKSITGLDVEDLAR